MSDHPINSNEWSKCYPEPKNRSADVGSVPLSMISVTELAEWMDTGKEAGKDYLVVDVRRTDCTVSVLVERQMLIKH